MYTGATTKLENSRISSISNALESPNSVKYANFKGYLLCKYGMTNSDIGRVLSQKKFVRDYFPISIFGSELSTLETCVKYLREQRELQYNEIAELLNRSPSTIANTYSKAQQKHPMPLEVSDDSIKVPVSIFTYRKLSTLEVVVMYLKYVKELKFRDIADYMARDSRVIWTVHKRALNKVTTDVFVYEIFNVVESSEVKVSSEDYSTLIAMRNECYEEFGLTKSLFVEFLSRFDDEVLIPATIFSQQMSPLRALVKYLREECNYSVSNIANKLNRTGSLISASYESVKNNTLIMHDFSFAIPLELFSKGKHSIMETVVNYLITIQGLSTQEVALTLKRDSSVVWAFKRRYQRKNERI